MTVASCPRRAVSKRPRLRPHQIEARDQTRFKLREVQAALLVACTGFGKTILAADVMYRTFESGNSVLFLAHRDTLIKQTSRKLTECGLDHGIIMAGFTTTRKPVQVASVQTLVRRLDKVQFDFKLIIIDEAHLSAAASYRKILARWPHAKIIGLTGSPCRLDGKGLGRAAGGVYDVMVESATTHDLVQAAYLVRPDVYAPTEQVDLSGVGKKGGDYDAEALAKVMDKPKITGNAIEHYKTICPGVPAVAWCANVAHAKHVAEEFNAAGIPAVALSGEDDTAERDKALAALASGEVKVITFAMLLVEGVDCPAIGCVIMLRPTMSLSSFLQVIGRGLRTIYAEGMQLETVEQRFAAMDAGPKGRICYVLDHAGLTWKHGFADEVREWSLDGIVKKKGKKREVEEGPKLKQCPKCYRVHHVGEKFNEAGQEVCPGEGCDHVYETKVRKIEHQEGTLTKVTPEMREKMAKARKKALSKAKTLEELQEIAKQAGYSENWAETQLAIKKRTREKYQKGGGTQRPAPPIEVYDQDLFRR